MNRKRNTKKILFTSLLMIFLLAQSITVMAVQPIRIQVDGVMLPPETRSDIKDGRVMLQMNEVFNALGLEIQWIESTRSVQIQQNQQVYELFLDEGTVQMNTGKKQIIPAPFITEGRTMVPLRFISELFGYEVSWSESARQVTITSPTSQEISIDLMDETEDEREILLFEEAVQEAVDNSYDFKNRLISIRQLEEQRESTEQTYLSTRPVSDTGFLQDIQSKQTLLGLIQTEINLEITELQAEIDEERIEFTVKGIFHDIINLENELSATELMKTVKELELQQQRLKEQQGMLSTVALSAIEEELIQFEARMNSLVLSLNNVYDQLSIITDIKEIEQYRVERIPYEFEVLPETDLTLHLSRKASADPYLKLQERQIEKAEKNLLLFVYTGMEEPYEVRRLTIESEKNNLSALKNRLEESLQNRYQTIRQTENQYLIAQSQLNTLEEQERIMEVQLDLGMIIEKDLMEVKAAVVSQRNQITEIELQHQILKILFDKPYLMPDYLN